MSVREDTMFYRNTWSLSTFWDKHKYSHIILHSPPNTSYTPCCQRLGGLSPCLHWQDKSDRLWEITFLPADCKDRYVTTQHLPKVGKREDWDQIPNRLVPIFYHCWHFREFYIMTESGFENVPLTLSVSEAELWKTDFMLFQRWGIGAQTWISPNILYKSQACAQIHTQTPKHIQDAKIKTSHNLFHLVCLEFFHLVLIPRAKLCILFCDQLAFNLFGILSPFLSVHRWVIAAALHPAKRGVSQLSDRYLDVYWTAIIQCGPEGRHVHSSQDQTQHWALPWYGCSPMLQNSGDHRWADSR